MMSSRGGAGSVGPFPGTREADLGRGGTLAEKEKTEKSLKTSNGSKKNDPSPLKTEGRGGGGELPPKKDCNRASGG